MTWWAKLYIDILGDPKLIRAARKGAAGLELLPWIIVFAKKADDRGRLTVGGLPVEAEDIAGQLPGNPTAQIVACLDSARLIGVLVTDPDGALRLAAWDRRNSWPSESREAVRDRVRR